MENLIKALGDDIKKLRNGSWIAKCKVHNDKDFAMSIKQNSDGSVMAHCFACGANGLDLYRALNLDLDELFGGRKLEAGHIPHDIKEQYETDRLVIAIYDADQKSGKQISLTDMRRYRLAVARKKGVEDKFNIT